MGRRPAADQTGPMSNPGVPSPYLRVSEADRQRAEQWLKEAYVAGRLGEGELDERLGRAMTATTRAELTVACQGLPPMPASAYLPRPVATANQGSGLAAFAHFSVFFLWLAGPLLAYAASAPGSLARREAAKAFNWQFVSFIALVGGSIANGLLGGAFDWVLGIAGLVWFVLTVVGGIRAAQGEDWRNPVMRLVPWEVLRERRR